MSLWGANAASSANTPKFVASILNKGSGNANVAANNTAIFANTTVNSFITNEAVGSFGVTANKHANASSEGPKAQATGWNLRRAFTGPLLSFAATGGSGFSNGETALISNNASSNATISLVANATGNLVSGTVTSGGQFVNNAGLVVTFRREKHLVNLNVTGGSGYANTDTIVVSNSTVNATAIISTVNATGGFQNSSINVISSGLFSNTKANTDVVITVFAANGAATNGTSATLTANLGTSTSGTVNTFILGGRSGRVTYECLVALSGGFVDASSNTLP